MLDGTEPVAMVLTGVPGQVAETELRKISSNLKRKTTGAIGAQRAAELADGFIGRVLGERAERRKLTRMGQLS
jgi:hypothetical protein